MTLAITCSNISACYSTSSTMSINATARIYENLVPAHPGSDWTRFVCISDTHSRTKFAIPPGDVLLHAGDLSSWGEPKQLEKTLEWLKTLDHPTKMYLAL